MLRWIHTQRDFCLNFVSDVSLLMCVKIAARRLFKNVLVAPRPVGGATSRCAVFEYIFRIWQSELYRRNPASQVLPSRSGVVSSAAGIWHSKLAKAIAPVGPKTGW